MYVLKKMGSVGFTKGSEVFSAGVFSRGGGKKMVDTLWKFGVGAVPWVIWLERSNIIFYDKQQSCSLL